MIIGLLDIDYLTYIENTYEIYNKIRALALKGLIKCPKCKQSVVMHGTYKRKVILSEFDVRIIAMVQVRCKGCKKVHAVIPGFIAPNKRYHLQTIKCALRYGKLNTCPADDSTIRRWRIFFEEG